MHASLPTVDGELNESRLEEIKTSLAKLERRDWWLWAVAIGVMLLLTLALVSLTFPGLLKFEDQIFQFNLKEAVRGLLGLVLLFGSYAVYQKLMIWRLRRQFSGQLDAMIRLQARAQEFQRLAITDPLTGLYNRRYAEKRLAEEAARSKRHGHPLTVMTLDLDNFKQINDRYGHLAGDEVLKAFAERLRSSIRVSDLAVRMGGDEFMAVFPECRVKSAQDLLARLTTLEVDYKGQKIPVKFSAGWVGYEKGETPEQFLERADRTLYAGKRTEKIGDGAGLAAQPAS